MEDFLLLVLHHCRSKAVEHEVQPCSQQGERLTESKLQGSRIFLHPGQIQGAYCQEQTKLKEALFFLTQHPSRV